jgi:hypothetical protein
LEGCCCSHLIQWLQHWSLLPRKKVERELNTGKLLNILIRFQHIQQKEDNCFRCSSVVEL